VSLPRPRKGEGGREKKSGNNSKTTRKKMREKKSGCKVVTKEKSSTIPQYNSSFTRPLFLHPFTLSLVDLFPSFLPSLGFFFPDGSRLKRREGWFSADKEHSVIKDTAKEIKRRKEKEERKEGRGKDAMRRVYRLMTRESLWMRLRSESPCLMTDWYCAFLVSGRVVSTMPATLSILQWSLPAAMKRESSLNRPRIRKRNKETRNGTKEGGGGGEGEGEEDKPIDVFDVDTKVVGHRSQLDALVGFEELRIGSVDERKGNDKTIKGVRRKSAKQSPLFLTISLIVWSSD